MTPNFLSLVGYFFRAWGSYVTAFLSSPFECLTGNLNLASTLSFWVSPPNMALSSLLHPGKRFPYPTGHQSRNLLVLLDSFSKMSWIHLLFPYQPHVVPVTVTLYLSFIFYPNSILILTVVIRVKAQIKSLYCYKSIRSFPMLPRVQSISLPQRTGCWVTRSLFHLHPCLTVLSPLLTLLFKKEPPKLLSFRGPLQAFIYLFIHSNHPFSQQVFTKPFLRSANHCFSCGHIGCGPWDEFIYRDCKNIYHSKFVNSFLR